MTFKQQLPQDGLNSFLNLDEFAESIVYTPSGGSPKEIKAIVTRSRLQPDDQAQGRQMSRQCIIEIMNDSTYGVTTVSKGNDQVSLPVHTGEVSVTWRVLDIMHKDDGMWKLFCER